jgi:hypothetical protein
MTQAEALRFALRELGDASAEELAAYIGAKYGITVKPQFVPVLKATVRDKEILAERRRKSREVRPAEGQAKVEARPEVA